jgi:DNA topoisomerase I
MSGVEFNLDLNDRRVAKVVKRCQELPGQELFQYIDEERERRTIDSTDVNQYLREVAQEDLPLRISAPGQGPCLPPELWAK